MADPNLGQVTITYRGPKDVTITPSIGQINREVQTITWTLVDVSGLDAKFKVPGGIVFSWPPPDPPPPYSRWTGTTPTGNETEYSANANDPIPHGNPSKFYSYDIVIVRKESSGERAGGGGEDSIVEEVVHAYEVNRTAAAQARRSVSGEEIIDPPVENQPLP
jgi:hypothetical protein